MNKLPYISSEEYHKAQGQVRGSVFGRGMVSPASGQCPRKRSYCDTDRQTCRYFGGVCNVAALSKGATTVAQVLCKHRDTGASDAMHEFATAKEDRG